MFKMLRKYVTGAAFVFLLILFFSSTSSSNLYTKISKLPFGSNLAQVAGSSSAYFTASGIPIRTTFSSNPIVGRINAKTGDIIENVHIVSNTGPCIYIDNT
jgi:hypothetical protein